MRFVLAIVAFVVAAGLLGMGIAQRTIFASPNNVTLSVSSTADAPVTIIDGATLAAFPGSQTITLSGSEQVVAAYGRTTDVRAWVGDATHNEVTYDAETGELVSTLVQGEESEVPNPDGSDLWFDDYVEEGVLTLTVTVPEDVSFVIASDGVEPAPANLSIKWPLDNSTPWVGPLVVSGAIVLLLGIGLLIWATTHMRSAHGPRRSMPNVPKAKRTFGLKKRQPAQPPANPWDEPAVESDAATPAENDGAPEQNAEPAIAVPPMPEQIESGSPDDSEIANDEPTSDDPADVVPPRKTEIIELPDDTNPEAGRTSMLTRRRGLVAVPIFLVTALVMSGCSADFWPDLEAGATPTPTATVPAAAELSPPATTVRQVERIVAKVSAVTTEADANLDGSLLETRFAGPALELRLANYTIRGADPSAAALPAIPDGPVKVTLPQQTDTWPRTVFAVIQDDKDATIPPVALFLVQEDPRSDYKVNYAITLEPSAVLPDVAPASIGAARLPADSGLLLKTPENTAVAYADILMQDVDSEHYLLFESEGDSLRTSVGLEAKNALKASLPTTATASFSNAVGEAEPIAIATNDAGAIVAVNLEETTTVTPTEAGAAINPSGQVKTLSGVAVSTKGVTATYGDQLLFYIPPAGGNGKIVLLGYSQGLIKASEVG
ncbi:hypothetical protein HDC94_002377 [Leifsonia sp. AK011]|uniref:hypothetical protein n=1 Tax=Leifsonia sp. AK011 TaxID=2723075 RepID=UPI0015C8319A|nr:hypothetical protein [Leifsonia sp. AK011]NYF11221.1 hypothetical protein [Leifsonia sp. AK011]